MPIYNIIGGEQAIDINYQSLSIINTSDGLGNWYSSGRSALLAILLTIQKNRNVNKVLIPEYNCESVISAVKTSGLKYELYSLSSDLSVNIDFLKPKIEQNTIILLNNYFGLLELTETIEEIKSAEPSTIIVEDDVQAFYYYKDNEQTADYSFTSLRKWFAIPDGGLARAKDGELIEFCDVPYYPVEKMCGLVLKSMRASIKDCDRIFLELLEKGEERIDSEIKSTASEFSKEIYKRVALESIAEKRILNAKYVIERLAAMEIAPLHEMNSLSVPLFIPICLKNRDRVRKALFSNGIFCPVHWPIESITTPFSKEMATHELSIIIDQRYGKEDMNRILKIISDNI